MQTISSQQGPPPFHLAVPSNDLAKSKLFYGEVLGCPQGRTDPAKWIDYNVFGSQVVAHFTTSEYNPITTMVDGIPVPNFGIHLNKQQWSQVESKLKAAKIEYSLLNCPFIKQKCLHTKDFTGNNLMFYQKDA